MLQLVRVNHPSAGGWKCYILADEKKILYVGGRQDIDITGYDISDEMFDLADRDGSTGEFTWDSPGYLLHRSMYGATKGVFRDQVDEFATTATLETLYAATEWEMVEAAARCSTSFNVESLNGTDYLDVEQSARAAGVKGDDLDNLIAEGLFVERSFIPLPASVGRCILAIAQDLARTSQTYRGITYSTMYVVQWASAASFLLERLMPNGDILDIDTYLSQPDERDNEWQMSPADIKEAAVELLTPFAKNLLVDDILRMYEYRKYYALNVERLLRETVIRDGYSMRVVEPLVKLGLDDTLIAQSLAADIDTDFASQLAF